jgi:hypothetical protein
MLLSRLRGYPVWFPQVSEFEHSQRGAWEALVGLNHDLLQVDPARGVVA